MKLTMEIAMAILPYAVPEHFELPWLIQVNIEQVMNARSIRVYTIALAASIYLSPR